MGRRELLLAVAVAALAALLAIYLLKPQVEPVKQPEQAVQAPEQPQQPAEQPAGEPSQPKLIVAVVEAGEGGRVLANGTEAAEWSSTSPFTLVLEAVPGRCMVFSVWEVNGSFKAAEPVTTIRVAGNTTIRAFFARPVYRVLIAANSTRASALVNGTACALPHEVWAPACSALVIEPVETHLLRPLNATLELLVEGDVNVTLLYWSKTDYEVQAYLNGVLQYVEVREYAYRKGKNRGVVEMQDGWIHIKGDFLLLVYIPWNYTRVVVEARNVNGSLHVKRFCEWGADPMAYGKTMGEDVNLLRVEFEGCRVVGFSPPYCSYTRGKRYEEELPGALRVNVIGEAWVRIEAYP